MSSLKMGHNQLFSNTIQILDEFLMLYIYLKLIITRVYLKFTTDGEICIIAGHIDSHSDCAYGHTRAHPEKLL